MRHPAILSVFGVFLVVVSMGMSLVAAGPARNAAASDDASPVTVVSPPLQLTDDDRVLFLGNTFVEREMAYGTVETALALRLPGNRFQFRNLGWSGDTVFGHARARFGSVADGFNHLRKSLAQVRPTVVLVAYGTNEAFAGPDGLDAFSQGVATLLDALDEACDARVIVLGPLRQENLGPPLPDPARYNRDLAGYRDVLAQHASRRRLSYVDLDNYFYGDSTAAAPRYTDNGMHLSAAGYHQLGRVLSEALLGPVPAWSLTVDMAEQDIQGTSNHVSAVRCGRESWRATVLDAALPYQTKASQALIGESRRVVVQGLPTGSYTLRIDSRPVASGSAAQWAAGIELTVGPAWDQADQLRQAILLKNELFFHQWRPQNETYLFLFRKHEQGNNAVEIEQFDPLITEQENRRVALSQPSPHVFEFQADAP